MAISAPGRTPRGGWSAKHDQQARNAGYACWDRVDSRHPEGRRPADLRGQSAQHAVAVPTPAIAGPGAMFKAWGEGTARAGSPGLRPRTTGAVHS